MMRAISTLLSSVLLLSALDGFGQFGSQHSAYREGPLTIQVVDMDQDGDNDLLLGSRLGVSFLRNVNGTGTLSSTVTVSLSEVAAHAVDVDGDGLPDVVASREAQGGIYWYKNLGALGFGSAQLITNFRTALSIASWDADGDGDMDLLFQLTNNTVAYSPNTNGLGQFPSPVDLGAVGGLVSMSIRDVDGDGDGDPVFASGVAKQVWWTENLTTGFQPQVLLTSDGFGDAADVDGDGIMDLLTANDLGGLVQWQRGSVSNFSAPLMIDQSGVQAERIHVADLDGDGDQDAALVEAATHELVWYENINGQGQFGPRQVIATNMTSIVTIASGDIDGDGDREVFVASDGQSNVYWFENLRVADDRIVGRVFNDLNGDGLFNGNDHGLFNVPVKVTGLGTTFTNHAGVYQFDAPAGNYAVSMTALPGWNNVGPLQHSAQVAPPQNSALGVDFPLQAGVPDLGLTPLLSSGPLRCDRLVPYWFTITNTGNQVSDVDAALELDALSIFSSSDPSPSTFVNGVPHYSFDGLQPTQSRTIRAWVVMPDASHIGATMFDHGSCDVIQSGTVVANSGCDLPQVLDCAYDPNDKQVLPEGIGAQHLTAMGTRLSYTIRFQNTGNAVAQTVQIVDMLSNELDLSSIAIQDASHPMETFLADDGTLTFTFLRINLPDSASDPLGSQGFVRFSIDHETNLPEGTVIPNTANIFFDNNPAIVTNTVENTMTYGMVGIGEDEVSGNDPQVFPNPMGEQATILLGDVFSGRVQLSLKDAMGRTVRSWVVSGDRTELHREGLTTGLYFLRATDARNVERVVRVLLD